MVEILTVPEGVTVRASCLIAGVARPCVVVPLGEYEVRYNPAGSYRHIIPAGQDPHSHIGTYYYPEREALDWRQYFANTATRTR